MDDPREALTLEKLQRVMRDIEVEQDARDLDMFLSDNWHAYRLLREGGSIIVLNGNYYVVARPVFERAIPTSFPYRFPTTEE